MSTLHEMLKEQVRAQWEAQQRERVFAEGKREGERMALVKQLTLRFGELGEADRRRIEHADDAALDAFLERVLNADSLAAVFGAK